VNRLTHARVWSAIDALARRYGLSASGLANAPASTPRRSTSRSASPAKADPAGPPPKADGEVMAKILMRRTAKTVELASFNAAHPNLVFPVDRIDWMVRIVWASQ
jgi:hypothetical protein